MNMKPTATDRATEPSEPPNEPTREPSMSLEEVIEAFERPLLRYAWRLVRQLESAQDIVQETFLRYHRSPPGESEPKQIATWLYRVAHNLCIDLIRKESRMRTQQAEFLPTAEMPSPADSLEAEDARKQLDQLLDRLTERQRHVLVLKVQEGKSYRQISEITGLSVSNVGFIIHTAMKRMTQFAKNMEAIR